MMLPSRNSLLFPTSILKSCCSIALIGDVVANPAVSRLSEKRNETENENENERLGAIDDDGNDVCIYRRKRIEMIRSPSDLVLHSSLPWS
jgi:hypothetical protein